MTAGIPAQAICHFLDILASKGTNMHGFLLMRHGEFAAEGYWKPFDAQTPHRMFSVGKSLTSLAIGMLAAEGKLSLDDRIAAYFPDKCPEKLPPQIDRMTIRHMLCMTSAHSETTYKDSTDPDWTRTFFTVPPTNDPGTVFAYDTSATHTLSALVERLSGQSLKAFLWDRLLGPLGCTGPIRWLADPMGVCQGGSGLVLPLRDLARVAACCLRGGDGLIPADYLREATSLQVPTDMRAKQFEQQGYGYQFWRTEHNSYMMYGMGGQLAVCLPDADCILCTVADTQLEQNGVQDILDAFWTAIYPMLDTPEDAQAAEALAERLQSLAVPPVTHCADAPAFPGGSYIMEPNNMGLTRLCIDTDTLTYTNATGTHALPVSLGVHTECLLPGTQEPCLVSAGLDASGRMRLRVHVIGDTPCGIAMQLVCTPGRLTIQSRCVNDPLLAGWSGVASGHLDDL